MEPAPSPPKAARTKPPRAPLAFRVGVVGHRPNRLEKANLAQLAETLRTILGAVKDETFAFKKGDEARHRGVPVVWVDAHAPHSWRLLSPESPSPVASVGQRVAPDGAGTVDAVRGWVREALELPALPEGRSKAERESLRKQALRNYYAEHRPRWTLAVLWKVFQQVVADGKWPKVSFGIPGFEEAVQGEWPKDRSTPLARGIDDLRPYYAWSDKLAVVYADRYRSADRGNPPSTPRRSPARSPA